MVKKLIDRDFLDGTLHLAIMPDKNLILGRLVIYDPCIDEILSFTAKAKCHDNDKFDEALGIKLVKYRIAKKYHSFVKNNAKHAIDHFEHCLREAQTVYAKASKKIDNINHSMFKMFAD